MPPRPRPIHWHAETRGMILLSRLAGARNRGRPECKSIGYLLVSYVTGPDQVTARAARSRVTVSGAGLPPRAAAL